MKVSATYLNRQFDAPARKQILAAIGRVARRGDFTLGKEVQEFEAAFAALHGDNPECVVAVQSGTAALELALRFYGIGPGDEVIVPSLTFVASVGAIVARGATPVYAEVRSDLLLDPKDVAKKLRPATKAIIAVGYSGSQIDDEIWEAVLSEQARLSEKYGFIEFPRMILDYAQCVGVSRPKRACDAACYSLHPLKNLNIWGDAGSIVLQNVSDAKQVRLLRNHGLQDRDTVVAFGTNARMSTVQAAVAVSVMKQHDILALNQRRRGIAARYTEVLSAIADRSHAETNILLPPILYGKSSYHLYIGRFAAYDSTGGMEFAASAAERDGYVSYLQDNGVDAKVHYPVPVHKQPASIELVGEYNLPRTEQLVDCIVSLPCHPWLYEEEIEHVCKVLEHWV